MTRIRTYSELITLPSFEERYRYLRLRGNVGESTFGFERYLNQKFYRSTEWRNLRHHIIARDEGCDLAIPDRDLSTRIIVHHMNPMTVEELHRGSDDVLNPEYLISVSLKTHNAIHYGDESLLETPLVERRPGDTTLWKPINRERG